MKNTSLLATFVLGTTFLVMYLGKFQDGSFTENILGAVFGTLGFVLSFLIYFKPKWLQRVASRICRISLTIFLCGFFATYAPYGYSMDQQPVTVATTATTTAQVQVQVQVDDCPIIFSHPASTVSITNMNDQTQARIIDAGAKVVQLADLTVQILVCEVTYTIVGDDGESLLLIDNDTGEIFRGPKADLCKVLFLLAVITAGVYVIAKIYVCGRNAVRKYTTSLSNAMFDPQDCPQPPPPATQSVSVSSSLQLYSPPGYKAVLLDDGDDFQQTTLTVTNGSVDWLGNTIRIKSGSAIGPDAVKLLSPNGDVLPYHSYTSTNGTQWDQIGVQFKVTWLGYDLQSEISTHTTVSFSSDGKAYATNWCWRTSTGWREVSVGDFTKSLPPAPQRFFKAGQ